MLSLNTNLEALKAAQALQLASTKYSQAAQRISTGLRVNSAKDDPAGWGLANRLKAQLGGLTKAIENINQGVAMIQTVDNALSGITSSLTAMRDLAVSSASGTSTSAERNVNQTQFSALLDEIDSMARSATYNGKSLLDGTTTAISVQADSQAGSLVDLSFSSVLSQAIGEGAPLALSAHASASPAPLSAGDLVINGTVVGASLAADDTLSSQFNSSSAIAKAAAINRISSSANGFASAAVGSTTASGSSMSASRDVTGTVTLNGVAISLRLYASNTASANRAAVVSQINAETGRTGVVATDTQDSARGIHLTASDGRNVTLAYAGISNADTGLAAAGTYTGSFTLRSLSGESLTLSHLPTKDIAVAGLADGVYTANMAQHASARRAGSQDPPLVLTGSDLLINGHSIRAPQDSDDSYTVATLVSSTKASSAIAMAQAINDSASLTNVRAVANSNVLQGTILSPQNVSSIYLNNVTINVSLSALGAASDNLNAVVAAINGEVARTGVTASNNGSGLTLTAQDGRNISIGIGDGIAAVDSSAIGLGGAIAFSGADANATDAITFISTVTLSSDGVFSLAPGAAGKSNFEALGFREGTYGGAADAIKVSNLDVSTIAGATVALDVIDSALDMVSGYQSRAGAQLNRLDYRNTFLESQKTTTTQAVSNIMDADYAEETAKLATAEILQDAATAILTQANLNKDIVSYLLRMN